MIVAPKRMGGFWYFNDNFMESVPSYVFKCKFIVLYPKNKKLTKIFPIGTVWKIFSASREFPEILKFCKFYLLFNKFFLAWRNFLHTFLVQKYIIHPRKSFFLCITPDLKFSNKNLFYFKNSLVLEICILTN